MKPVSTAAQMRELDRRIIEDLGLPGIALMEIASRGVAEAIRDHHHEQAARGVIVVCGGGNNGGDGYGAARWLAAWGYPVRVMHLAEISTGDAGIMRAVCAEMGVPEARSLDDCGLLVDAIFGTGLSRAVGGRFLDVIGDLAAHPAEVVAVDIPSGLSADTGAVLGACAPAVTTVTFGRLKAGLLAEPGAELCGAIEVVDIGLQASDPSGLQIAEVPEEGDLRWPARSASAHKKSSGHLLVVAGSRAMSGAAILACRGALAAGVGLVSLLTPRGARLAGLPPEVMVIDGGAGDVLTMPDLDLSTFTGLAVGPGLGGGHPLSAGLLASLVRVWSDGIPAVFDADALVAASGSPTGPRVITPHAGEAARLLSITPEAVQADRFAAATQLASDRTALLKGRNTLVATPGRLTSVNPTGGPTLATGGSGDVLCGVIGALLARGVPAHEAAQLAAWVHGAAADRLADRRSHGWVASDIADAIAESIGEL